MLVSAARVRFEPLRSLAFGSISGTYAGIGAPFSHPVRLIHVTNLTDADLFISFNGTDDHAVVSNNGFFLYDYSSNKSDQCGFLEQASGERVYAREIDGSPTEGSVYVTVIYASAV